MTAPQGIRHRSAMTVTVSPAIASDLASLQALDPWRQSLMAGWIARGEACIARDGAGAVGYAMMTQHFFARAFIELLMVAESHRRRGVATAMLRYLEANCPTDDLWTSTNESNAPMRALLVATGYTPSGAIEGLDEGDPELFFRKRVR